MIILETQRLILREITAADFDAWSAVLGDPEVMYAYEHGFSAQEVRQWIARQRERYARDGFGLWAAVERLGRRDRELFLRKYYYYQPIAQIAAESGLTVRAVEGKLYRIRKHLQSELGGVIHG